MPSRRAEKRKFPPQAWSPPRFRGIAKKFFLNDFACIGGVTVKKTRVQDTLTPSIRGGFPQTPRSASTSRTLARELLRILAVCRAWEEFITV